MTTTAISTTHQSSNDVSMATPRCTQCDSSRWVASVMKQIKLVEWPVVLRMPRRSDVLYTGHAYDGVSTRSDFRCGLNQMMGAPENSTCL